MNNWEYEVEELLSIVSNLAEKYTRRESSSITYEKARQLMEAVEYCIQENHWVELHEPIVKESLLHEKDRVMAEAAYEMGYQIVLEKVNQIRTIYNQLVETFDAYGNRNYEDTVLRGISGFLLYYDARFEPQNHILTMDYPVLWSLENACGVDAILRYLKGIALEQHFLHLFPKDYIIEILSQYHSSYKTMYFNLCIPLLHHILGSLIVGKNLTDAVLTQLDYEKISDYVIANKKDQIKIDCSILLKGFLEQYEGNYRQDTDYGEDREDRENRENRVYGEVEEVFHYLYCELDNFVPELCNAAWHDCIESIFSQN